MTDKWTPVVLSRDEVSGHSPITGDRAGEEWMVYVPICALTTDASAEIAAKAAFVPPIATVRKEDMAAALAAVASHISEQEGT